MDKINKYKQNNHNARGDNRRRQRARINFVTISNVSSDLLEAIDELASRQDRSRSNFGRRELERIVVGYRGKEALSKSQ